MTEIKFRTWIPALKEFHYWGFLNDETQSYWQGPPSHPSINIHGGLRANTDRFTGLLDRYGKEIYERDGVKCYIGDNEEPSGAFDLISFRNGSFYLNRRNIPVSAWLLYAARDGEDVEGSFEVIGNIHETKQPPSGAGLPLGEINDTK